MIELFYSYQLLIDAAMIAALLALSQFIVLKAGLFSIAPVGLQAVAAYAAAILQVRNGFGPWTAAAIGILMAVAVSLLLAIPLARLRGVFQAIATLSFVIVVQACLLIFVDLTGGPNGINGIPQSLGTGRLAVLLAAAVAMILVVNRSRVGRAFDALRLDEVAAASHGVSVFRYHVYAFGLSGLFAGLSGAAMANYTFSVVPEAFGFQAVVNTLTAVVIGGVVMVGGPLFGTTFLLALPEIIRPLADERLIVNGALLVATAIFMPRGVIDGIAHLLRIRRARRLAAQDEPPGRRQLAGADPPSPDEPLAPHRNESGRTPLPQKESRS